MPDPYFHSPSRNHLLAALPANELARLLPHLDRILMSHDDVLYEPGSQVHYVYFPTTCIVTLFHEMSDGRLGEIAIVGNEGLVGVSLFMSGKTIPCRSVVHGAGEAYRLPGQLLMEEFERQGPTQRLLLRYTMALLTHVAQTAVRYRHHSLEQQLCRLLLQHLDRLPSNELTLTQELIARMLGVRREGVTEAACHLQKNHLIEYHRGHITVLDRPGLEAHVCECYAVVRNEFARLLPDLGTGASQVPASATCSPLPLCGWTANRQGNKAQLGISV